MENKANKETLNSEEKIQPQRGGAAFNLLTNDPRNCILNFLDLAGLGSMAATSLLELRAVKLHLSVRRHLCVASDADSADDLYEPSTATALRIALKRCKSLQKLELEPSQALRRHASKFKMLVEHNSSTLRVIASLPPRPDARNEAASADCFPVRVLRAITQCSLLEEFTITPQLRSDGRITLLAKIFSLPMLRSLTVHDNEMNGEPTPIVWMESVSKASNLTHLAIRVTGLEQTQQLASGSLPGSLTSLSLKTRHTTELRSTEYYDALSKFRLVTTLTLQFGLSGQEPAGAAMIQPLQLALPSLTKLTLPHRLMSEASVQLQCPELKEIEVTSRASPSFLAQVLSACQKLEVLRHRAFDSFENPPLGHVPSSDVKWTSFPATLRQLSMQEVPLNASAVQALASAVKLQDLRIGVDSSVRPSHLRALVSGLKLVAEISVEVKNAEDGAEHKQDDEKCESTPLVLPLLRHLWLELFSDGLFRNLSAPNLEILSLRSQGFGPSTLSDVSGFLESLELPVHMEVYKVNPAFLTKVRKPIPVRGLLLEGAGTEDKFGRGGLAVEVMAEILKCMPTLTEFNPASLLDLLVLLQHQPSVGQQLRVVNPGSASVSDILALLLLPRLEVIRLERPLPHHANSALVQMASKLPCLSNGRTVRVTFPIERGEDASSDQDREDEDEGEDEILLGAAHPLPAGQSLMLGSSGFAGTEP